jgi:hypothetical protein
LQGIEFVMNVTHEGDQLTLICEGNRWNMLSEQKQIVWEWTLIIVEDKRPRLCAHLYRDGYPHASQTPIKRPANAGCS